MGTEDQTQRDERTEREEFSSQNAPQAADESIVDLAQQPIVKQWTKFVTALFALVGVGFGLVDILLDAADQDLISDTGGMDGALEAAFSLPLFGTPYFAVTAAVLVGAFLGWKLDHDDKTTFLAAGISTFVGTAVFWIVAAVLGTIPLDVSLDFGGLLVNSIVAGIAVTVVAAGGVWAVRNLAPDGVEMTARAAEPTVHATDD